MNDRLKKGLEVLRGIDGSNRENGVMSELKKAYPDFVDYIIGAAFADIYSRPELDKKSREIATIAALTVLGYENHLQDHVRAGLAVGCTEVEIKEVIMQMAVYSGIPVSINAMLAAEKVFKSI